MTTTSRLDPITQLGHTGRLRTELPAPSDRKAIRVGAKITATEMSKAVGVSRACIHAWESGRSEPRSANRDRYVRALTVLRGVQ